VERVLVIGCSGSGKTTLARKIAAAHNLPWTSLDNLFWKPGWVESSDEEFFPKVDALCNEPRWVIDGTFSRTLHLRLPRADTVIWLDLPLRTCLWSVLKRVVQWRGRVRPEMPAGC
jgi:adenylate kinase family enzyme